MCDGIEHGGIWAAEPEEEKGRWGDGRGNGGKKRGLTLAINKGSWVTHKRTEGGRAGGDKE